MRQLSSFLALALLPAAASAVILFNAGAEITATGAFPASKETSQGGLILYLKGDPDGATIDLETQPFRTAQGSIEWIPLAECSVTALPAVCKVAVGQGALRLNVTGGLGSPAIHAIAYEASAVVGEVGGDGGGGTAIALDWAPQDGILNVFDVVDGVSFDLNNSGSAGFTIKRQSSSVIDFLATSYNSLRFDPLGGAVAGAFSAGVLHGPSVGSMIGGAWRNLTPTETVPTGILLFSDLTTGLGYSTAGGVALIDDATIVADFTTAGVAIADGLRFEFPQSATAPPGTESASYWDTSLKELCIHDGSSFGCINPQAALIQAVSGEMHQTNQSGGGGPHISIPTAGTFVGWVDATSGPLVGGVTFTNNATADFLSVPDNGTYAINVNMSFSGAVNRIYICRLHVEGVVDGALVAIEMGNNSSVNSGASSAMRTLIADDQLSIRCTKESGAGTDDISIYSMVLEVIRVD